jgi:hypothetical protein
MKLPGVRALRAPATGQPAVPGAGRSWRLAAILDGAAFDSLVHSTLDSRQEELRQEQIAVVATTVGLIALIALYLIVSSLLG